MRPFHFAIFRIYQIRCKYLPTTDHESMLVVILFLPEVLRFYSLQLIILLIPIAVLLLCLRLADRVYLKVRFLQKDMFVSYSYVQAFWFGSNAFLDYYRLDPDSLYFISQPLPIWLTGQKLVLR